MRGGFKSTGGGGWTIGVLRGGGAMGGRADGGGRGVTEGGQIFKFKNRFSHHEIASSKQFWGIAFLEYSKA